VLQNKGIGMGGLTGSDSGGMFTARRGIEKTLFWVTIILSVLFFILTVTAVILEG
jgi:preprotein translocase subunit SecG